jgi:hypothetical protein
MAFDPLTAAFDLGGKLLDHFFPDPTKRAEAALELEKLKQNGDLAVMTAQSNINAVEAANPNLFISGWRPACGWVCAFGLLFQFLLSPCATYLSALIGRPIPMPNLDTGTLVTLLGGMLGLSGMRTFEKITDVNGKH